MTGSRRQEQEAGRTDTEKGRHGDTETGRHGDTETGRHGDAERRGDTGMGSESRKVFKKVARDETEPVSETSPRPRVSVSPRPLSPRPRVSVSPSPLSPRLRVSPFPRPLSVACLLFLLAAVALAQTGQRSGSHPSSSRAREVLSAADREMVEQAMAVVCLERARDERGSLPIDDMQKRPSMPLQAPDVVRGAARAQRLLPVAKDLVIASLRELSATYEIDKGRLHKTRISRAIARIKMVRRIKPDIDARDNASVFMKTPHTITFGTIFLAGLRSDEGMVSVLAHELVHIGDGDADALRPLFRAVGARASLLTGLRVRDQRAEELTCDLVGSVAVQAFIANSPNYDPLPRRLARSVEHNCVEEDDSDEEHLSPRNTLRALLTIDVNLRRGMFFTR
jgi:hypothetical protein